MIEIFSYSLSYLDLSMLVLVAILVGMAKTGVAGAGMIAVPLLAIVFGGRTSTGVMLPLLIMADVFAVKYYHKHTEWKYLRQLLPFAFLGVLIGTAFGHVINDLRFKQTMVIIIFLSLILMIWQERIKDPKIPDSMWFTGSVGIAGGITTMIGNLAGPIMALYLLAMRLPKNHFIGTAAWFFMTVNVVKVPFHVFVWETMSLDSILLNLSLLPAVALGAYLGIKLVALLPEQTFRYFVIIMTAVAALGIIL